jgi:uncharacterized membrane protein
MSTLDGLRMNVLADGLFSIGMVIVTSIGFGLLWQSERRTDALLTMRPLAGSALIGLGAFNLYDAIVNHTILGLHHPLSQGGQYNPHWAAVSFLFVVAGYYVYRTGTRRRDENALEHT